MILRSLVVLIPMLLGMPGTVFSQVSASYPAKPIRLIVPAAPGATSDVLARLLVEKLQTSLGVSLVVENQAGAGGAIAAAALTRTAPDGYILMLGDTGSISVSVAMNPKLSYHPLKDMTLITNLVIAPPVLVVPASVPAATLQEFIALAKSRPGQLNYGSAGPGSFHHLAMAALVSQAGIDLVHVPYKGGNPMVQGLLAGEVSIGVSGLQNAGQAARAGRLKILGITSPRRIKSQPDIPTLDEQGLRGFNVTPHIGVQAAGGMPRDIVARLQGAFAKAIREPDIVDRIANLGMEVVEDGTENYATFVKEEIARYTEAVKAAGLKVG